MYFTGECYIAPESADKSNVTPRGDMGAIHFAPGTTPDSVGSPLAGAMCVMRNRPDRLQPATIRHGRSHAFAI